MNDPKNHHYIPQAYLRNFSTERNGEYYVYVRYKKEKFHETNIRNICSENYFYTIPNEIGPNKNLIEKFYADNIDNSYTEISKLITDDNIKSITDEQRKKILFGIINLYFRTPRFLRYFEQHITELSSKFDDYNLGKTERHKVNFFGKIIDFQKIDHKDFSSKLKEKGKILFLSQHIKLTYDLVEFKLNDGIGIAKIEGNSEFITSDNPVTIRNAKGNLENIFDTDNIINLPINKKHLITITPKQEKSLKGKFLRISASSDYVTGMNNAIESKCDKWIIGSKDGVNNHLEKVEKIETDPIIGKKFIDSVLEKEKIVRELSIILDKNNGILTQEVLDKLVEASKSEIMKDDENMIRYISELKQYGLIK